VAIQIIVAFGHAHRIEGFRRGELSPQAALRIHSQSAIDPGDPASKPIGLAFEYCAICVVINMGASTMPAEAPASGVPVAVSKVQFSAHAEAATWTFGHLLFQARAPPSA
jgi:hypothetical protein